MIAFVKGKLVTIQEESVIVETAGIGYEIFCPNPFKYQKDMKQEIFIYTYLHVREDSQTLFGFPNEDEKLLFTRLISVSGIGPKSAIAMLGSVEVPDFIAAIETEDEKYLTQFPGVGKKTARQIILDLKGKLSGLFTIKETQGTDIPATNQAIDLSDVKEALKMLGYTQKEIQPILPALRKSENNETDQLVKEALGLLVKQ